VERAVQPCRARVVSLSMLEQYVRERSSAGPSYAATLGAVKST
jgi:hypothetical protein